MPLERRRVLARHRAPVSRVRWTDDGKYCISCGHDKTLRLWNPTRSEVDEEGAPVMVDAAGRSEKSSRNSSSSSNSSSMPMSVEEQLFPAALHIKEYSGAHGHEVKLFARR